MEECSGLVHTHENPRASLDPIMPREEHARTLASTHDVPEEAPEFQIELTSVGISGKTVWVGLPRGRLPFDAKIETNLPAGYRGIHMSRIEEAISSINDKPFDDICSYSKDLARMVLARQNGNLVIVRLRGKIPIKRETMVSGHTSMDTAEIEALTEATMQGGGLKFKTMAGVTASHMTACPCTQVYNQDLFKIEGGALPLMTHSQRSLTRLLVERSADNIPSYDDLLECLESALHVTQDLLKRPDEAEIVIKAHLRPQFAEDAVRQTAKEVGIRLGDMLPGSTDVTIESTSLESIHIHDVCCCLKTTLREIIDAF